MNSYRLCIFRSFGKLEGESLVPFPNLFNAKEFYLFKG